MECFAARNDSAYDVVLTQQRPQSFTVTYGLQVKRGLTYGEAAKELGECLMHRAACDGKLNNA